MAASIGLKLYTLGQKRDTGPSTRRPTRPPGELVWLHAPSADQAGALMALARHLIEEDGVNVLLTCPQDVPQRDGVILQAPPPDLSAEARQFLDHWRPACAEFADGELRPAILHEAAARGIPLFMANGRAPRLLRERDAWYPGLMRSALGHFTHVGALDEGAALAFRKAGAVLSSVAVTGRMEEESTPLPCLEAERAALARLLSARPVWFAAGIPVEEEAAIIHAHRVALQQSHRLLLIVMPANPAEAAQLASRLEAETNWNVAARMLDQEPDPGVEVFVVDNPAEYGLWYRLAPVTFLGGSLLGGGLLRNPMEPAALGSAILHGPHAGHYGQIVGRLGAARAARAVASAVDLAEAVGELLAPDRAARLAQAAWRVISDGAEVTEDLLNRMRRAIEAGS